MIQRPPNSTRTDTLVPDTTRFRAAHPEARPASALGCLQRRGRGKPRAPGMASLAALHRRRGSHRLGGDAASLAEGTSAQPDGDRSRSEEHTSELQSLMRNSYAGFCLKKHRKKRETEYHKHQT